MTPTTQCSLKTFNKERVAVGHPNSYFNIS